MQNELKSQFNEEHYGSKPGKSILSLYKDLVGSCFVDRTILIIGGTGSFGQKFVTVLFEHFKPKAVIVFSRDEFKQHHMRTVLGFNEKKYPDLHYVIGDIRNKERIYATLKEYRVDIVVHAAAIKHVDICEKNPTECIDTNITGTINLVNACKEAGVKKVLALSTDKCVDPINIYGASKLCLERLIIAANNFYALKEKSNSQETMCCSNNTSCGFHVKHETMCCSNNTSCGFHVKHETLFSVVRYGNVLGSRGSVIHVFAEQIKNGEIKVTDENMTRFTIMKEEAVNFAMNCLGLMIGGEIFVPELYTYKIGQLVNLMKPKNDFPVKVIGVRPGEKIHECMISKHESHLAFRVNTGSTFRSLTYPKVCQGNVGNGNFGNFYVIRNHYYGDYVDYKSYYDKEFSSMKVYEEECIKECGDGWSYRSDKSDVIDDQKLKGLIAIALCE
jgi:UDP-N-acetylglucosamine 4,6-dehydratase